MHVLVRQAEGVDDRRAGSEHRLGTGVDRGPVAVPPADHHVRLHRMVIVDGGRIALTDHQMRCVEAGREIATAGLGGIAPDHWRGESLVQGPVERGDGRFGVVVYPHGAGGGMGGEQALGGDQGDRLAREMDQRLANERGGAKRRKRLCLRI